MDHERIQITRKSIELEEYSRQSQEGGYRPSGAFIKSFLKDVTILGMPDDKTTFTAKEDFVLMYIDRNSEVTIVDLIFEGGYSANYAGSIYVHRYTTLTARRCSWYHSTAGTEGGAIKTFKAVLKLYECDFSNNAVAGGTGGAIQIYTRSRLYAYECTFSNNTATTGGAASGDLDSELEFYDCIFANNTALNGGALSATIGSEIRVTGGQLSGNKANNYGGVGTSNTLATIEIDSALVTDNQAVSGGGFFAQLSNLVLTNVESTRNIATGSDDEGGAGGLLHAIGETATVKLTGGTVQECTATERGGAVSASNDVEAVSIDGTTFLKCETQTFGGAVSVDGKTLTDLRNSIFEDNMVSYAPEDVCLTLTMTRSTGQGWKGAELR